MAEPMLEKTCWNPILKDGNFERVSLKEKNDGNHTKTQVIALKQKECKNNAAPSFAFMNTGKNARIFRPRGQSEVHCFIFFKLVWKEDDQCYEIPNSFNDRFVAVQMSTAVNSMAMNEIAALQNLGSDHPNILNCIEALRVDKMVFLITPYFQDVPFFGFDGSAISFQALEESQARHIFSSLISAIERLQAKNICHSSIAAENVAVGANGEVLLVGFHESFQLVPSQSDLGEEVTSQHHTFSNSRAYMPPEIEDFCHSSSEFNAFGIDIWSVCVLLFVMFVGNLPGNEFGKPTIAHAALHSPESVEEMLQLVPNTLVQDLLRRVFKKDPKKRLSLQDIQSHPWLQKRDIQSHPCPQLDKVKSTKSDELETWEGTKQSISKELHQEFHQEFHQALTQIPIQSPHNPQTKQQNTTPSFAQQAILFEREIRDDDVVLCDVDDKQYKNHPGNLFWKEQIDRYKELDAKMAMLGSENIVEQIEHRHCRFLKKSDIPGLWTILSKDDAIHETYKKIRKQSEKNDNQASNEKFSFAKQKHNRDGKQKHNRRGVDSIKKVDSIKTVELKRAKLGDSKRKNSEFSMEFEHLHLDDFADFHPKRKISKIVPTKSWNPSSAICSQITENDIHEVDVLFGGIGKSNPQPGNIFWKECCDERSAFLSNSANMKSYGKIVAREICQMVWNRFPPGRFLQKAKNKDDDDCHVWIVLSDEDAIEKTLQMFRTGATAISWPDQYAPFVIAADAARCVDIEVNGEIENAWLMKEHDPEYAYCRIEERMQRDIERRGKKLGDVSVCAVYSRRKNDNNSRKTRCTFIDDQNNELVLVTVKRFSRLAVSKYLAQDVIDDPLLEFDSARLLDDDRYILRHLEILKDESNIYVVEPYCNGGNLFVAVHLLPAGFMSEDLARSHFFQILMCLNHLQKSGVCHHSLSPENIVLKDGKCVFSNFGQALRVPFTFDGKRQLVMAKERPSANPSFMAPEVFRSENFDGYATDLWSGLCVLYFMLTGLVLYKRPDDELYNYFVKGGLLWRRLSREESRKLLSVVLEETNERGKADVVRMIEEREAAHQRLDDKVLELFSRCFQDDPLERGTLADVCYHEWLGGQNRSVVASKAKTNAFKGWKESQCCGKEKMNLEFR